MGERRERWEKERQYEDYRRNKKRGKRKRNSRSAARAANAQWSAIANELKTAGNKARKEKGQGARKKWRKQR